MILVIEDTPEVRENIAEILEMDDYKVLTAADGKEGVHMALENKPDLIICDISMPVLDGYGVLHMLQKREEMSATPFIFLSARTERTDIRKGMELGADDYLTKPFAARELLARVRAVLRRAGEAAGSVAGHACATLEFAGWRLDVVRRELRSPDNVMIPLSNGEFELLLVFAEHPRRVLSRQQLLDMARGDAYDAYDRSIDVQVSRLRRKLETDNGNEPLIRTLRNAGYLFTPTVAKR